MSEECHAADGYGMDLESIGRMKVVRHEESKPVERASLLCICGNGIERGGTTNAALAKENGWRFFPHSKVKDGTNALCDECQALDE